MVLQEVITMSPRIKNVTVRVNFRMSLWQCIKLRISGLAPKVKIMLKHASKRFIKSERNKIKR